MSVALVKWLKTYFRQSLTLGPKYLLPFCLASCLPSSREILAGFTFVPFTWEPATTRFQCLDYDYWQAKDSKGKMLSELTKQFHHNATNPWEQSERLCWICLCLFPGILNSNRDLKRGMESARAIFPMKIDIEKNQSNSKTWPRAQLAWNLSGKSKKYRSYRKSCICMFWFNLHSFCAVREEISNSRRALLSFLFHGFCPSQTIYPVSWGFLVEFISPFYG